MIWRRLLGNLGDNVADELDERAEPAQEVVVNHPVPIVDMREVHQLHPYTAASTSGSSRRRRIGVVAEQNRRRVEVVQGLLLEPRLELPQLRQDAALPSVHRGGERAVQAVAAARGHVAAEHAADPGGVDPLQLRPVRAPHGAAPGIDHPDAGDAEAEERAGGLAVLGEALGDVGVRGSRRPRAGADLDVGDAGGREAREEVVEDDVRVGRAAGAGWGREEAGAVEAREEGAPDPGRDGRVRGERGVEGGLVLPALPGLEGLVEEPLAVDERAQLVGGRAVPRHLVLRRAQVGGHGGGGGGGGGWWRWRGIRREEAF